MKKLIMFGVISFMMSTVGYAQTFVSVTIDQVGIENCASASVNEVQKERLLNIYPNPASKSIAINWKNSQPIGKVVIKFYNQFGQTVLVNSEQVSLEDEYMEIDISSLSNGIYTVNVIDDEKSLTSKLIIE
jgi:hypothetical protein